MPSTVIITNTLHPSFFVECAHNDLSIYPKPVSADKLREYVQEAERVGVYSEDSHILTHVQELAPYARAFYKNEVTINIDTDLIVIDFSNPITKFVIYTVTPYLSYQSCRRKVHKILG